MDDKSGLIMQQRRTRAEIEQIVAEFTGGGVNRTEFCRRHGMSLGTLNRYLKQRREQGGSCAADDGLVTVELVGTKLATERDAGCGLAVVLSHERRIEVGAGFDEPTLQRLVNLLEKM
jgi:transposase-like protein